MTSYRYRCNGLSRDAWGITGCESDRVSQTVNGITTYYTLDQAAGLTQVLDDGTNTYLYGAGRIAQVNTNGTEYFLGDALGSVRQMTDAAGAVTLAKAYDPYGVALQSIGNGSTNYGFTGEMSDSTGLLYLWARYYAADTGRFISRDTWPGQSNRPLSLNRWSYVEGNVVNYADPSGHDPMWPFNREAAAAYAIQYKDSINPVYGEFGGSDCTNFASQTLKAGGFPEDDNWFFDEAAPYPTRCSGTHVSVKRAIALAMGCGCASTIYRAFTTSSCGKAWALTNELHAYLTANKSFNSVSFYFPYHPETGVGKNKINDDPRIANIKKGDIVFYHSTGHERFNHVAVVVDFGPPTKNGQPYGPAGIIVPYIVDHSGPEGRPEPRALDDTQGPLDELTVVHIPQKFIPSQINPQDVLMRHKKFITGLAILAGLLAIAFFAFRISSAKYTAEIALIGGSDGSTALYLLDLNWQTYERLTPPDLRIENFVWDENGEHLIFVYSIMTYDPTNVRWNVQEEGLGKVNVKTKKVEILYRFPESHVVYIDFIGWRSYSPPQLWLLERHPFKNDLRKVFTFDLRLKELRSIEWEAYSEKPYFEIAFSKTSTIVGVNDGKIYLLDYDRNSALFLAEGSRPVWLNRRSEIAYLCNTSEICVIDDSGKTLPSLGKLKNWDPYNSPYGRMEFSFDNRFIAYYAGGGGENPVLNPIYLGIYDTQTRTEQFFFDSSKEHISLDAFAWRPK